VQGLGFRHKFIHRYMQSCMHITAWRKVRGKDHSASMHMYVCIHVRAHSRLHSLDAQTHFSPSPGASC
ncbi:MAG: hypothetical protein ACK55Z_01165, partial [bacterium]